MSDSWDRNSEACPSAARQEGKKQEVREKARGRGGGRRCSDCNIVSVDYKPRLPPYELPPP